MKETQEQSNKSNEATELVPHSETEVMVEANEPPKTMLQTISDIAKDPSIPIDRLNAVMDLQERWEDREGQKLYSVALAAAKAEIQPVVRNKRNNQTNSRYSDLEAIDNAITPIMSKHGLTMSFAPAQAQNEGHYAIKCTVRHAGGYSEEHHAEIPIDAAGIAGKVNKTKTHAFGSTMAYGRRYLKMMIVDVATTDDTDGNTPQKPICEEQMKEIQKLLSDGGHDIAKFCNHFKIESLKDITVDRFDAAVETIRNAK